jgi:hypothetical protein
MFCEIRHGVTVPLVAEPSFESFDNQDNIIFVDDIGSFYPDESDVIAKEIWMTLSQCPVDGKGIVYLVSHEIAMKRDHRKKKPINIEKSTCHVSVKMNPVDLTKILRDWIGSFKTPYTTLVERTSISRVLGITPTQVSTFCNNYRKRFNKHGKTASSYTQSPGNDHGRVACA